MLRTAASGVASGIGSAPSCQAAGPLRPATKAVLEPASDVAPALVTTQFAKLSGRRETVRPDVFASCRARSFPAADQWSASVAFRSRFIKAPPHRCFANDNQSTGPGSDQVRAGMRHAPALDRDSFGSAPSYGRPVATAFTALPRGKAREGFQRSDICANVLGLSGRAVGVPLDLEITILTAGGQGPQSPCAEFGVYVWQCDAAGEYSFFNRQDANYLRGIGMTSREGRICFETIFPGAYRGRIPHIHLEVYQDSSDLCMAQPPLLSTRILFSCEIARAVYEANAAYTKSLHILDALTFARDPDYADLGVSAGQLANVKRRSGKLHASKRIILPG
jgi:protocatechuate 3,4-dioxygenase beta subunit